MYAAKGAGQRLTAEYFAGHVNVDSENRFFRNQNSQDFFLTNAGRIMRYDNVADQYNEYDHKTKDFKPCDGLNPGETIVKHGKKEDLFNALLAKPGWGDWFCTKGYNFGAAAGKQILFGAATATAGSIVGPVLSRGTNRLMDSVGFTAPAAQAAIQEPAAQTVGNGLSVGVPAAKAQGLNAIHGHVVNAKVQSGIAHTSSALRAANQQIINPPFRPRCPVNDPFFPHGPNRPFDPFRPPFGPCVDPIQPWNPWARGLFGGGTTATGAVVGTFVGGPIGGVIGGALGAGVGSFLGA